MEGFFNSPTLLFLAVMLSVLLHLASVSDARNIHSFLNDNFLNSSGHGDHDNSQNVKKWAVLVAGSNTFANYRHQADVCHAYQILKAGGLKDENIIVFMSDDIANNPENRKPGVIINKINGPNVYEGVPKDYTGEHVNAHNFYNVINGISDVLTGGSGKVLTSGPDDHIFIYYADHGSPGSLSMPVGDPVYADDFMNVLKIKHEVNSYSKMVIYIEACESGSMVDGLLPEELNIYVTTSANPTESSYSCYYDSELGTYLGDSYSVSWMEDSEAQDLSTETLEEQYQTVVKRTGDGTEFGSTSHVMQYGTKELGGSPVSDFLGSSLMKKTSAPNDKSPVSPISHFMPQRDVQLYQLGQKYLKAPRGSTEMYEAKHQLDAEISHRKYVDETMKKMINAVFGSENATTVVLETHRPAGKPLVDDWGCFKSMVKTYEKHCGKLSTYAKQYTRAMANMCNSGIRAEQVASVASVVCGEEN